MTYRLTDLDIQTTQTLSLSPQQSEKINGVVGEAPLPSSAMGALVRALDPYLAAALIAPDHLTNLCIIADQLPGALSSYFGFECRLAEEAAPADILFCVRRVAQEPAVLAGVLPGIPPAWLRDPAWQRIQRFAQEWVSPTTRLCRKVQDLWLEFDVAGTPAVLPIPSAFFGSKAIGAGSPSSAHRWISEDAVRLLTGQPLPPPVQQRLLACIAALPPQATIFQMGAMLSRQPTFVRLCINRMDGATMHRYLQQIGWPGDYSAFLSLASELATFVDNLSLNLDLIDSALGPRIGLECGLDDQEDGATWARFLDYLVADQLCLPAKRDGLLAYLAPPQEGNGIRRGLHHIKVVMAPNRPLEAKAYLSVR